MTKKPSKLTVVPKASPIRSGSKRSEGLALDFKVLNSITDRAFFLALQMIDIANHQRPDPGKGEPKVGGHPSACASSQHILGAIHLAMRKPEDYFACKPHVSPIDHAFNFLLDNFRDAEGQRLPLAQKQLAMRHLRHFSKEEPVFQSYHAEADPDSHRYFPSGSVGIPPVNALYTSLGYSFAKDHRIELNEDPTFWCLMGDSEFREGSLMEAMPDAGERQLGNLVWIVDYNRQNLDGTRVLNEEAMRGSDADRIVRLSEANGWRAVKLKHGKWRERLFREPGGDELQRVLDEKFTDFEFQALLEANKPELTREVLLKKSSSLKKLIAHLDDNEVQKILTNLAGHDLESLVEVFTEATTQRERPTLVVAYTIKGRGLQCQAQSGNHSALPEAEELEAMAERLGLSTQDPFQPFSEDSEEGQWLAERSQQLVGGIDRLIEQVAERKKSWISFARNEVQWPADLGITALKFNPIAHTQWMWGQVAAKIDRLARGANEKEANAGDKEWAKVAPYFLTMAPDVGSSTNTSPNMNGKLYGDIGQEDFEKTFGAKDEKAPDIVPQTTARTGHLRFEIAEGNCMSAAGSFGKFFHFTGIPFFPAMTIYDFFIKRAHDQFYYNLYWHSKFATLGTPSGVTLAPEGAQHSWKSDFQIPNCVTWEPYFAKELEWIMADMLRRHFTVEDEAREGVLIRCVTKGAPQKELLERTKIQSRFNGKSETEILETIRQEVLKGGYCLVDRRDHEDYKPGDNVVHIFALGSLVEEAVRASDKLLKSGICANVFVVTSTDLLLGNYAHQDEYDHLKNGLGISGDLIVSGEVSSDADWYFLQGNRVPVVSVHDGEPGLLDNIGSIVGTKQVTLAIRKTSKSGTTADVYHYHGIDAEGVSAACEQALKATAQERIQVRRGLSNLP